MGEVITFYSFKGGVGRSMGLANVAALYAQRGKRVLALDFDFEAPGLHRYFLSPREEGEPLRHKPAEPQRGVLNYLRFVQGELERLYPDGAGFDTREVQTQLPSMLGKWLDAGDYIYEIEINDPNRKGIAPQPVSFIAAARFDETYPDLVRGFNWQRFYELYWEVFPALARELSRRYDIVLIDSRTGITDIGSICTMLLPDKLVLAFTPNEQSLRGALDAGWQAIQGRQKVGRPPLHVYPLLSRLEDGEEKLKRQWIARAQQGFERLFREGYGYPSCDMETYFNAIRVPHRGYYAYGERIAVEEQRTSETGSLAEVYHDLLRCLECDGVLAAQEAILKGGFTAEEEKMRSLAGRMQPGPFADAAKLRAVSPLFSIMNAAKEARQGRTNDALRAIDDIISQSMDATGSASRVIWANALYQKAHMLLEVGQFHEALGQLETLITNFEKSNDVHFQAQVADAYYDVGYIWAKSEEHGKALSAVEHSIQRYASLNSHEAHANLAKALLSKAESLRALGRGNESLAIFDDVILRFGKSPDLALRRAVWTAMVNKVQTLGELNRAIEARATQEEIISRFGDSADADFRQSVGLAMLGRLGTVVHQPRAALELLEDVISRLENAEGVGVVYRALASGARIGLLARVERYLEGQTLAMDWLDQYSTAEDPRIQALRPSMICDLGVCYVGRAKQALERSNVDAAPALLKQGAERIQEALELAPENAMILENAAYVAFLQDRVDDARALLKRALEIDAEGVRSGALEDMAVHPIPQDEAFRKLLDELAPRAGAGANVVAEGSG